MLFVSSGLSARFFLLAVIGVWILPVHSSMIGCSVEYQLS
jgi:hypothetical protein